jgi:hypothetical protein
VWQTFNIGISSKLILQNIFFILICFYLFVNMSSPKANVERHAAEYKEMERIHHKIAENLAINRVMSNIHSSIPR